ncbi:LLM class flavin-dependent oxidoreductase [Actinopolymorpha pittospori]|uniref:Alkanesulfonate monooxygenase SsuD/methylene tetrahydromethanopterin reductase-like flavin-dependent oxidoreductase (Luciferase family) n=1 Tax=Actinopolymorpha pittospori TaxID=648752 RepID=A0A927MPG4_9ACTN|nr:alkanesulfonate monooxygenase SsuD/methylene tetrahydromethanopterin reductase-like flavin-dependent oxidoreductase (luciferase family) [Actinopolymorpha pittospori]
MRFGLSADFRNPPEQARPSAEVFADIIDHLVWAESLGFSHAAFGEHHFAADGFLPSPLVAATAVAARTKTMRVATNIAILPFYDPVRLAEDGAVLDVISNGRFELGVGLGWAPEEFAGYGIDPKTKRTRADEALQIIRGLWRGETMSVHGTHFQIDGARITPRPVQDTPPIWVGGPSRFAVRRAAWLGDGYTGPAKKETWDLYRAELAAAGKDPDGARAIGTGHPWLVVSEDPERTLARYAPGLLYWYAHAERTGMWPVPETAEDLVRLRLIQILTPDEAIHTIAALTAEMPMETFTLRIAPPGVPARELTEHLELFATKVIPHFA